MADPIAAAMSEPSTAKIDDVLAGMDHAEVHYFNRCVKITIVRPPTLTMDSYNHHGTFKLEQGFLRPITDGLVFVIRHTRGNAGTYIYIFP